MLKLIALCSRLKILRGNMKVYFVGLKQSLKHKNIVKKAISAVVEKLCQPRNISVCVNFVDDEEIKNLNKQMRNVDKVTDVLSFPNFAIKAGEILDVNSVEAKLSSMNGKVMLGDMAINLAQLARQAKDYNVTLECELAKLVIHSALHLFGYDHIEDSDYEVMKPIEDEILNKMTKF